MLLCQPAGDAPIHLVQLRPPVAQPNPVRSPWGCLSCVLGSTTLCRRCRLLVWPGACLDLAVHLHELLVFQAFFANENSFPLKKTLFIKKKNKNQVINPNYGSVLGRAVSWEGGWAGAGAPTPAMGMLLELLLPVPGEEGAQHGDCMEIGRCYGFPVQEQEQASSAPGGCDNLLAGAHHQRDKIFMAALTCFPFQATVTYLLQIYMHV